MNSNIAEELCTISQYGIVATALNAAAYKAVAGEPHRAKQAEQITHHNLLNDMRMPYVQVTPGQLLVGACALPRGLEQSQTLLCLLFMLPLHKFPRSSITFSTFESEYHLLYFQKWVPLVMSRGQDVFDTE